MTPSSLQRVLGSNLLASFRQQLIGSNLLCAVLFSGSLLAASQWQPLGGRILAVSWMQPLASNALVALTFGSIFIAVS